MTFKFRCVFCSLFVIAPLLYAEENLSEMDLSELSEVEYTEGVVSFFQQSVRTASANVQTFDLSEMEETPVMTLADLLAMHAVGSSIGTHERQGALHGVRGIMIDNNAKTLVMVDGLHVNLRTHFGYSAGMNSPLLFGDMARVEVVNGPGAILHGSGAINGFINLMPKTGSSHKEIYYRQTHGFSENLNMTEVGYGGSYGDDRDLYIYFGAFGSDGFRGNDLWGRQNDWLPADEKAYGWVNHNYRTSLNWNHGIFNLYAYYQELNQPANYSATTEEDVIGRAGKLEDTQNVMHQQSLVIRPKLEFELSSDHNVEISLPVRLHDQSRAISGLGRELLWDGEIIYRTTAIPHHSLALGAGYGEMYFDEDESFFGGNGAQGGFEVVESDWKNYYLLGEDIWHITDRISLLLGLRMDWTSAEFTDAFSQHNLSADKGHLSPRLAFVYDIDDDRVFKASYQHGFRQPDAAYYKWHIYFDQQAESLGLPNAPPLEEETLDSFEINYSQQITDPWLVEATLFHNEYKNLLRWFNYWNGPTPDHAWTPGQQTEIVDTYGWLGLFLNSPEPIKTYGAELSTNYEFSNTSLNASYGYTQIDGLASDRFPAHQIKLNTISRFFEDRLSIGVSYLFSRALNLNDTPDAHSIYLDDRHLVELSARYKFTDNLSAKLVIKNLFQNDVPPIAGKVNAPNKGNVGYDERRIYLTLQATF